MNRIAMMKGALIAVAALLTAVLFLWPTEYADKLSLQQRSQIDKEKAAVSDIESTTMLSPRFSGEDNHNQKWEVKATKAHQINVAGKQQVSLEEVQASLNTTKGENISFEAGVGNYSQEDKSLDLKGGVIVKGYGLILETEALSSDLDRQSVHGEKSVTVKSAAGVLSAQSFSIEEDGKIKLSGGVKGTFTPRSLQKDAEEK